MSLEQLGRELAAYNADVLGRARAGLAALVRRGAATAVSGDRVTVATYDGNDMGPIARLKGAPIAAGDEVYLLNVTGDAKRPGWLLLGAVGGDAVGGDTAPIIPAPAVRDGSSTGTYTDTGIGVTFTSLEINVTGLAANRSYLVLGLVKMRLAASTGAPLQQCGIRTADGAGGTTQFGPKGGGHMNGTGYEWTFGAGSRLMTGVTAIKINGVAYASTSGVAHNVAGGQLDVIVWPR